MKKRNPMDSTTKGWILLVCGTLRLSIPCLKGCINVTRPFQWTYRKLPVTLADIPSIRAIRTRNAITKLSQTTSILVPKTSTIFQPKHATSTQPIEFLHTDARTSISVPISLSSFSKPYTEPTNHTSCPTFLWTILSANIYKDTIFSLDSIYNETILVPEIRTCE